MVYSRENSKVRTEDGQCCERRVLRCTWDHWTDLSKETLASFLWHLFSAFSTSCLFSLIKSRKYSVICPLLGSFSHGKLVGNMRVCLWPCKILPPGSIFHIYLPQQRGDVGHGPDTFYPSSIPQFMDGHYHL